MLLRSLNGTGRRPAASDPLSSSIDDTRQFIFDCAYARSVEAAISLLADDWDEVWLDYDLEQGNTVEPVVAWIAQRIRVGRKPMIAQVVIHSSNPKGAAAIEAGLGRHYPTRRVGTRELQNLSARR